MTRAAALKAVRTMRANKALRQKHSQRWSPVNSAYEQKKTRIGRAERAVSHRNGKGKRKGKIKWGPGHPLYDWKMKHGKK